jgi:hypothetical protein
MVGTVSYAKSTRSVTINLGSSTVSFHQPETQGITKQAPMITGALGWSAEALFTVGDQLQNGYRPASNLDGIGVIKQDATTVRIYVNHELSSSAGPAYTISNGNGGTVTLTGARIDYFDIDIATRTIKDGGAAITSIIDRSGNPVAAASQLNNNGLAAFCSSTLVEANKFGIGRGLTDSVYFTGEETSAGFGGSVWALDTATGTLTAIPDFGRGKWENVTPIDTGDTAHVAFLLGDDTPGAALYLYIGTKQLGGDLLARNGLRDGQLYVWAASNGALTAANFAVGSQSGTWKPISVRDTGLAGTTGYDATGYKSASTLAADADALGAFSFARIEDQDLDPQNAGKAVFTATGNSSFDSGSNTSGTVYAVDFDFSSISKPTSTVSILHNSNTAGGMPIRSPDNVEWSADGWIYIQEDRAADIFGPGSINSNEASILRLKPQTGEVQRIATVERNNYPAGFADSLADTRGSWETTGIIDVSAAFGFEPGSLFLTNVMAHGTSSSTVSEGGQMLFLSKSDIDALPSTTGAATDGARHATGSVFDDVLTGDLHRNFLRGLLGDDIISGRTGNDVLVGGGGRDVLWGDAGIDRYKYLSPKHGGDVIGFFSLRDYFVFEGSAFGQNAFQGTLSASQFRARKDNQAQDLNDHFIFRKTDDTLWYDANGSGKGGLKLIADLANDFVMTASDILIV